MDELSRTCSGFVFAVHLLEGGVQSVFVDYSIELAARLGETCESGDVRWDRCGRIPVGLASLGALVVTDNRVFGLER